MKMELLNIRKQRIYSIPMGFALWYYYRSECVSGMLKGYEYSE